MTPKERLIELIMDSVGGCARNWAEVTADHLLKNGIIVPPCKVGDTVYYFYKDGGKVYEGEVTSFVYVSDTKSFSIHCDGVYGRYGRYFFLTREEAEQALNGVES